MNLNFIFNIILFKLNLLSLTKFKKNITLLYIIVFLLLILIICL